MAEAQEIRALPKQAAANVLRPRGTGRDPILMRLVQKGTLVLRGPVSGQVYLFYDRAPRAVRSEDVAVLLATGLLEHARGAQ
jgi:hypothetical protein